MFFCRRLRALWFSAVALLLMAAVAYRLTMPGALFLLRFLEPDKDAALAEIIVRDETARFGGRSLRCHLYSKGGRFEKVMLVIHGVHHGGYDEERMVGFARQLARLGHLVVTPEIEDLKEYNISERAANDIHLAAKWLIETSGYLEAGDKLVVLGFSFAGGLAVGAASRPDIRDRVSAVFSFGGHADLDRVMRYLQSGNLPNGDRLAPHVYGQAVIVRQLADRLVSPEQVTPLRAVLHDYLKNDFKKVKSTLHTLAPESRRIAELCLKRDVDTLGRILEASVQSHKSSDLLSPIRGQVPSADLYLLHGGVDNVIPRSESETLARWASGATNTRVLITDLITHVELEETKERSFSEYCDIIRFFTELLRS